MATRNILKEGADWLKTTVYNHTMETVTVTVDGTEHSLRAALVDEEGRILPGTVPTVTEHTRFMFERSAILAASIAFKRNTLITWSGYNYQVVFRNNKPWTYNDTFKTHIIVDAKHVP